jgi:Fic/DOC family
MLFSIRDLAADERPVFERIEDIRYQLRHLVRDARRWAGVLTGFGYTGSRSGTGGVAGINGAGESALAAVDGDEAAGETLRAVRGYGQAIDFILQSCCDRKFRFTLDTLLGVHFRITQHNPRANPGCLRPDWVGVSNSKTGKIVYEGVDRDHLECVLVEFIDSLNGASQLPPIIRAAMAHLNLVMAHPFSDGNGRTARCIQTALLVKEGIVAPEFASIEEYIGRNQSAYYAVLSEVGGRAWAPERDAHPWVRFCLTAHYRQAKTLLRTSGIVSVMDLIHDRWLAERSLADN